MIHNVDYNKELTVSSSRPLLLKLQGVLNDELIHWLIVSAGFL